MAKKYICDVCGEDSEPLAFACHGKFTIKVSCVEHGTITYHEGSSTRCESKQNSVDICRRCAIKALMADWLITGDDNFSAMLRGALEGAKKAN